MTDDQDNISETDASQALDESEPAEEAAWFDTVQGAALVAKASFPDQIDYYNPEKDEII
jgi:hypothetical protein